MSAYVSAIFPDGAFLLADGAIYTPDAVLLGTKRKIWHSDSVAVTARGHSDFCEEVSRELVAFANQVGPAAAIEAVPDFAADLRNRFGVIDGEGTFEVIVTAFIPGIGGAHRWFQSKAANVAGGAPMAAYDVLSPAQMFARGARVTGQDLAEKGLSLRPGESTAQWARRGGLGIMEHMRRRPQRTPYTAGPVFQIGGHVDLLAMTAKGASLECIHIWPDKIGEAIRPVARPLA